MLPIGLQFRFDYEGLWIAGAARVHGYGHIPVVNFHTVAGPLTFYLRAIAQHVSGFTPLGDARLIVNTCA